MEDRERPEPGGASDLVEEPPLFYVKGPNGKLVAAFGLTADEYRRLVDLQNALDQEQQQPRYTLPQLTASARVVDDHVHLQVELEARVHGKQALRVPVRLGECDLLERPRFHGGGKQFLDVSEEAGYQWWIVGKPDEHADGDRDADHDTNDDADHHDDENGDGQSGGEAPVDREADAAGRTFRLSLVLSVPIDRVERGNRLRVTVPRALTSRLTLEVEGNAEASALGGEVLQRAYSKQDDATTFKLAALDGAFTFNWQPQPRQTLDARSEALLRCVLDRDRAIRTEATLTVNNLGESFRVRLPPGAELANRDARFGPLQPSPQGDVLSIRGYDPAGKPLKIATVQTFDEARTDQTVELAGFDVLGTPRQTGYLALQVHADWQVRWEPLRHPMEQIDRADLPEEAAGQNWAAAFRFWRQPTSLRVRLVRPEPRIRAEAEHRLLVRSDEVRLRSRLLFSIDRARVRALQIDVRDWEVEDVVDPGGLIDANLLQTEQVQPLLLPLVDAREGIVELEIHARRRHVPGANTLTIPIPRPEADVLSQKVWVQPENNVSLVPVSFVNGVRQPDNGAAAAAPYAQRPLYYGVEGPNAELVAEFRVRSREVLVGSAAEVTVGPRALEVRQQLNYRVQYEPLSAVAVELPEAVARLPGLQFRLEDEPLEPVVTVTDDHGASDARVLLPLPPPARLGPFAVTMEYAAAHGPLQGDDSMSLDVALARPLDATLHANAATVRRAEEIAVRSVDDAWTVGSETADGGGLLLESTGDDAELQLVATLATRPPSRGTIVQRAWLQTWFGQQRRADRLVYRFSSTDDELLLALPPAAVGLDVQLDGAAVPLERSDPLRLRVPLSGTSPGAVRVLEVRYQLPGGLDSWRTQLEVARLESPATIRQTRWQIVVPDNRHLLWWPAELSREFAWRWQGTHWGRAPLWDQQALETWCGAAHAEPLPGATNRYLLASLAAPQRLQLVTSSRTALVGAASLVALAVGLLVIYVPRCRSRWFMLCLALAAAFLVLSDPPLALLLAQASALGWAAVLAVGGLRRILGQPGALVPPQAGSSSYIDRGSTEQTQASVPVTGTSTLAAPLAAASPSSEVRAGVDEP